MQKQFSRIGLFAKHKTTSVTPVLQELIQFLDKHQYNYVIESQSAGLLPTRTFMTFSQEELGKHCDLAIVVGGDGSLLNAARAVLAYQTPVLGINRGRLGFLADILPNAMEQELKLILEGHYQTEKRFLLQASIRRDQKILAVSTALNDVVLYSGTVARMIEFEVYINELLMLRQQADGVIASTPTGSTAYALSAGGPILYPTLNAIALTPLCPHTFSSRPIVVDSHSKIKLNFTYKNDSVAKLSYDGQLHFDLNPNDQILIEKHPIELTLIHPKNHQYFTVLREKLGWNAQPIKD